MIGRQQVPNLLPAGCVASLFDHEVDHNPAYPRISLLDTTPHVQEVDENLRDTVETPRHGHQGREQPAVGVHRGQPPAQRT